MFLLGVNGSKVLTNLNVRGSVLPRMINFANLFANCINLKSVTGFSDLPYVKTCGSMFNGCSSLTYTDLQFPSNAYDFTSLFQNCTNLAININDYLCAYKINSSEVSNEISGGNLFYGCENLSGTINDTIANLFWNNDTINWTNTADAFTGCSDELRAQVPVSWGGTNELIENSLNFKKFVENNHIDLNDYSAFDVWPTSEDIPAGTIIENVVNAWDNSPSYLNGQTVEVAIPYHESGQNTKQDTEIFKIRSYHAPENIDVIVDWGDGTYTELSSLTPSKIGWIS